MEQLLYCIPCDKVRDFSKPEDSAGSQIAPQTQLLASRGLGQGGMEVLSRGDSGSDAHPTCSPTPGKSYE